MEVEMSAEDMQALYNQSVPAKATLGQPTPQQAAIAFANITNTNGTTAAPATNGVAQASNGLAPATNEAAPACATTNGTPSSRVTPAINGNTPSRTSKEPKAVVKGPKTPAAVSSSSVCEAALLSSLDQATVTNPTLGTKTQPKIVFRPRAMDVSQLASKSPARGLASPAGGAGGGLAALMQCQGQVFHRGQEQEVQGVKQMNEVKEQKERDYSQYSALQGGPRVGEFLAYR